MMFNRESLKEVEGQTGRVVAIACDGSTGRAATLLGLSDEFIHQSCRAYGACAAIERYHQRSVPTAETRAHNLTFDLGAYGDYSEEDITSLPSQGFHLKLFGSVRHRYMALAVPKCESKVVKTLKMALYQSLMRNVFQVCFNRYKTPYEPDISDMESVSKLKFSPRLFEIKLAQRMENVGYIQDSNLFVVTEGEAARCLNFHSGFDVNIAIRGMYSLQQFLGQAVPAETENAILQALLHKYKHAKAVAHDFIKNGMAETMYT